MLINLRNALMSGKRRLPYDAEVEYLECTGSQWIDTGILPVVGYTYEMTITPLSGMQGCIFGAGRSSKFLQIAQGSSAYWVLYHSSASGQIDLSFVAGQTYNIVFGPSAITINGNAASGLFGTAGISADTIVLFARKYAGEVSMAAVNYRMHAFKILNGDTVVADFIPVRKSGVGYLYDRVSGKLFGNAGTGDFVLGQDVVPVEYLQSSGKQYIDTGVVGYKTTKVESHCALLNANSAYPAMWGARTGSRNNDFQIYYNTPTIGGNPSSIVLRTGNSDKSISTSDIGVNTFIGTRLDIVAADGALSVNGYNFSTPAFSNFTTPHSILMFCEYTANSPVNFGSFVYWGMKMWQADSIVRSFLPVRVGTEGAMMDTLTRRIYRNAGTGAFTYGNDLNYPIPAS